MNPSWLHWISATVLSATSRATGYKSLSESWGEGYFQVRGSDLQSFPRDTKAAPYSDLLTSRLHCLFPSWFLSATTYSTKCSPVSVMTENHCTSEPSGPRHHRDQLRSLEALSMLSQRLVGSKFKIYRQKNKRIEKKPNCSFPLVQLVASEIQSRTFRRH